MALQTLTTIQIKGGPVVSTFYNLEIEQHMNDHHTFHLEVREDELIGVGKDAMTTIRDFIGQVILIKTTALPDLGSLSGIAGDVGGLINGSSGASSSVQSNGSLGATPGIVADPTTTNGSGDSRFTGRFKGIITEARLRKSRSSGRGETVALSGYSPTIILDDGPESHSFENKTFEDIAHTVMQEYDAKLLEKTVKTRTGTALPYTVQYKESDFGFINRMAQRHGEWFYYTGTELVLGTEQKASNVSLNYGVDLHSFDFRLMAQSTRFKFIGNDNSDGTENEASTQQFEGQINGFAGTMVQQSAGIFRKETVVQHNQLVKEGSGKADIQDYAALKFQAAAGKMVELCGTSEHPAIRLGTTVEILDGPGTTYGRYIVTRVTHSCSDNGDYENHFTAVPRDITVAPYTDPDAIPYCESQPGVVYDNNDPKGLGRIRVKMAWQNAKGESTPWIQVISPHGGGDKGFHFIPETGEKVMVDFQGGNAEMPYVIGNIFNTNAQSGFHTANNDVKAIRTRSGSSLMMNDADGSISLADNGNANFYMDGAGNAAISAAGTKTISVGEENSVFSMDKDGNISLNADTSITLKVGEHQLKINNEGLVEINGKDFKQNIENTTEFNAKTTNISSTGGVCNIDSDQSITISGTNEVKLT